MYFEAAFSSASGTGFEDLFRVLSEEGFQSELPCLMVIAPDLRKFRDDAFGFSPFDMKQQIDRVSDAAPDGRIGELNPALKDATGEAVDRLGGGVRMNGRKRT
jgi:hypothetical protein